MNLLGKMLLLVNFNKLLLNNWGGVIFYLNLRRESMSCILREKCAAFDASVAYVRETYTDA